MPITRSAKKALRVSDRKKAFNIRRKNLMLKSIKEVKKAAINKEKEAGKKALALAYKALDKAAKKGLIKKNTASRKKARLAKLLKKSNS